MEYTFYIVCISLVLCNRLAVCPIVGKYTCIPEDGATAGSGVHTDIYKHKGDLFPLNRSISVSVIPRPKQTPEITDTCKAFLTLHGEYGTSLPSLLRPHRPHCNVRTDDIMGSIMFATIAQVNKIGAACRWRPTAVKFTNLSTNRHRVFRCERSMAIETVSKLRRRRSTSRDADTTDHVCDGLQNENAFENVEYQRKYERATVLTPAHVHAFPDQ